MSDISKDDRRAHRLFAGDSEPDYNVTNSFYSLRQTSSISVLETDEQRNQLI